MASFRMHFMVPLPTGPIESKPGPDLPAEVQAVSGIAKFGTGGRYVIACDPSLRLTEVDRGTHVPYAVHCPKCKATEVFKALYRPHPRDVVADGEVETEQNPMCC